MTEREIRAEILLELAELYRDPLSRSQFKRFAFRGAEQATAAQVLRELQAHLLVEPKLPFVVRLTDLGWKLIEPELGNLMTMRGSGRRPAPGARGFGVAPPDELVERVSKALGGADFVMATQLVDGRFVVDWATSGLEAVTGYTVQEIETLGGWPALLVDVPTPRVSERLQEIAGGRRLTSEVSIRTKRGRVVRVRHESWPMVDGSGTRVVGTVSAMRKVPRTSGPRA